MNHADQPPAAMPRAFAVAAASAAWMVVPNPAASAASIPAAVAPR